MTKNQNIFILEHKNSNNPKKNKLNKTRTRQRKTTRNSSIIKSIIQSPGDSSSVNNIRFENSK